MSRPIQVDDLVKITLDQESEIYQIRDIQDLYIYISINPNDPLSLIYPNQQGQWVIYQAEHIPYQIEYLSGEQIEQGQILTRNLFIDLQILTKLNDSDLETICQLDDYIEKLCEKEELWREKIIRTFGLEALKYLSGPLKEKYYILINTPINKDSAKQAIENNQLFLLKYLYQKGFRDLNSLIIPVIFSDNLEILKWIESKGIKLSQPYIISIVMQEEYNPPIKILEYFADQGIFPEQFSVDSVGKKGRLKVLKVLSKYNIYPSLAEGTPLVQNISDFSKYSKEYKTLEWLIDQEVIPIRYAYNEGIQRDSPSILKLLMKYDIQPNIEMINQDNNYQNVNIANWLAEYGIYPEIDYDQKLLETYDLTLDQTGVNKAALNDWVEFLIWFKDRGLFPDQETVNKLTQMQKIYSLFWLAKENIFPDPEYIIEELKKYGISIDQEGIHKAISYILDYLVVWLMKQGFFPNQNDIEKVIQYRRYELLKWLGEQNIFPDQERINFAKKQREDVILDWLAKHNLYPNQ